ncbi:unnamed protein product, partial [Urochloa humidicola]
KENFAGRQFPICVFKILADPGEGTWEEGAATGRAPGAALSSLLGDDSPAWWSGAVVPHVASGAAVALAVAMEQSTREAVNPSKVRW